MRKKLQNLRLLDRRQILAVVTAVLFLCTLGVSLLGGQKAQAATSSTLNFQARLMNADGSIAPDGDYSIEFKLYNSADAEPTERGVCDGGCVWVETRTGGNAVRVKNGYVTVNLGSVNPFGANINWDQELWLTMNIGGIGSIPKWDGEMSPRLKLTAVPYAFQAGQLSQKNGENRSTLKFDEQTTSNEILLPDESGVLCIQGSEDCGFVQNGGVVNAGGSGVAIDGTLSVSVLGAAEAANFLCYNSNGQIAACDVTGVMETIVGVLDATNLVFTGDTQVFDADGSVDGVDIYSTIAVRATADDLRITVPAPGPAKQVVGRVLYITAVGDSKAFTALLAGTDIEISLKANGTATLLWNGTGWTVADAMGSEPNEPQTPVVDEAYLGSMYYDPESGTIQCYEAGGWGTCAAAPDNIVTLIPEYAGGVVGSEGIGIMSNGFCSNDDDLMINAMLCEPGKSNHFYQWTSFEATPQTRSIYVSYRLPANFKGFASDDTVRLLGRVDDTDNASVTFEMYRSNGSDIVQCSSIGSPTDVIAGASGVANMWYSHGISGNEATECGFDETAAGSTVIFKINLTAGNSASAYVGALSFVTTTR